MADAGLRPDDYELARQLGESAAISASSNAPDDPLLAIAWAIGFGRVDQVQAAVDKARANKLTWRQIAEATGEHWETTRSKYGGGRERMRAYRRRQRAGE